MNDTATAHHHWDQRWRDAEQRNVWSNPEDRVARWAGEAFDEGARKALDLGCGIGRHALYLAGLGYTVDALDSSETGLAHAQSEAGKRELTVNFHDAPMTDLPFADATFDYLLSWNVIYHGDGAVVRRCIAEIHRVLKPGGLYQGTMLSKRNKNFGLGREVAPDTWINETVSDKSHPHFYCDGRALVDLFGAFDLILAEDYEQRPDCHHWHIVTRRPA